MKLPKVFLSVQFFILQLGHSEPPSLTCKTTIDDIYGFCAKKLDCMFELDPLLLVNDVRTSCPDWIGEDVVCCHEQHENVKLLATKNCGTYDTAPGYSGNFTEEFEYPFVAVIKSNEKTDVCLGALISDQHILTTSDCDYRHLEIFLGKHNLAADVDCHNSGHSRKKLCVPKSQQVDERGGHVIDVTKFDNELDDHLWLITLTSPVNISGHSIKPICLPITLEERLKQSADYTMLGFGTATSNSSSKLKQIRTWSTKPLTKNNTTIVAKSNSMENIGSPLIHYYDGRAILVGLKLNISDTDKEMTIYHRISASVALILDALSVP